MGSLSLGTFRLVNSDLTEKLDFKCYDKKIHTRFKSYNKPTQIQGFEQKLQYLLTYLMNFSYLPLVLDKSLTEKDIITSFSKSLDIFTINKCISNWYCEDIFKGLKISKNYSKHDENHPYGDVITSCFPLNYKDSVLQAGNLDTFLKTLKVDLNTYLFDDSFIIIIDEFKDKDVNKKFINKACKKATKLAGVYTEQLW